MVSVSKVKVRRQEGTKNVSCPTGIPEAVQAKFEAASGLSFEDVRVHYNSSRPAQLGAYAYTQGSQVYIGPGQERHLEHELGHVIQQKQGIVKADGYINGVPVNRDPGLERAADQGANQPVQGFWKSLSGVAQMMLGGRGGDSAPALTPQAMQPPESMQTPGLSEPEDPVSKLPTDRSRMTCDDVLTLAMDYLGAGYTEPDQVKNKGRYVSSDGRRVVRMGSNDVLGKHGGGRHVNFELLEPNLDKPGKMRVAQDRHVYLTDNISDEAILQKMVL